ncbi:MAG: hypothetical protein JO265_06170 [Acidimicrobiia bacterium]|nr:hypothetical protein [Acidimicrobiia bacterium]
MAAVVAAGAIVSSRVPAHALEGLQSGYWWQGQPNGAPLPPPPNVPPNGLWISGNQAQPLAIAALRFQLDPDEAAPTLVARVNSETPPAQVSAAANADQVVVMACPTTGGWQPAQAGAWNVRPHYDCAGAVDGTPSADGTTISFDLSGLVADGKVDVALVPGTGAAVLPLVPVPGATPPQPSGFDLTLQPVATDQVHTTPATPSGAALGSGEPAGPPPVSPDVGAAPSALGLANGAAGGATLPNFNFAATAVRPGSGTAASSVPSVAPGSLAPQEGAIAASTIKDNKGYRALAAILLATLLWWAWRQAVPPRRRPRTIYDGPSAASA